MRWTTGVSVQVLTQVLIRKTYYVNWHHFKQPQQMTNIQIEMKLFPCFPQKFHPLCHVGSCAVPALAAFLLGICREISFAVFLQHISQHNGFQTHRWSLQSYLWVVKGHLKQYNYSNTLTVESVMYQDSVTSTIDATVYFCQTIWKIEKCKWYGIKCRINSIHFLCFHLSFVAIVFNVTHCVTCLCDTYEQQNMKSVTGNDINF